MQTIKTGITHRWSISKMFNEDVLMNNGAISAITIEEMCIYLNELDSLRDQLSKERKIIKELVGLLVRIESNYSLFNKRLADSHYNEIKSMIAKASELDKN